MTLARDQLSIPDLIRKLADDPWSLSAAERFTLLGAQQAAQQHWLPRLAGLVEPPRPDSTFPAFLLELAPFSKLARRVGAAIKRAELDVQTQDELQHFVDHFRGWFEEDGRELRRLHGELLHGELSHGKLSHTETRHTR